MNNFNFIDKINIESLKNKIKLFNKEKWDEFDFRQKSFEVHKKTRTIPLIFDTDFRMENPTYLKDYSLFSEELNSCEKILHNFYGKGFLIRAILVSLKARCNIDPHVDGGNSLEKCFRVHLPIITNNKVKFTVGGETKIFQEGELWEINNSGKLHSVENHSDEDRIHLILDWITQQ